VDFEGHGAGGGCGVITALPYEVGEDGEVGVIELQK